MYLTDCWAQWGFKLNTVLPGLFRIMFLNHKEKRAGMWREGGSKVSAQIESQLEEK